MRLFRNLIVCIVSCLISCASVRQQTYLTNSSLTGLNNVATIASVSTPEIIYRIDDHIRWFRVDSGFGLAESIIVNSLRPKHAEKINEQVAISLIEEKTAQSFSQLLIKAGCFQTVEYASIKNSDNRQLVSGGFDAVIRLDIRITIRQAQGDRVKLSMFVYGQMKSLNSGNIIWDREEVVSSSEPQPITYYETNGLKGLDVMLEKASINLSKDFINLSCERRSE